MLLRWQQLILQSSNDSDSQGLTCRVIFLMSKATWEQDSHICSCPQTSSLKDSHKNNLPSHIFSFSVTISLGLCNVHLSPIFSLTLSFYITWVVTRWLGYDATKNRQYQTEPCSAWHRRVSCTVPVLTWVEISVWTTASWDGCRATHVQWWHVLSHTGYDSEVP